MARIDTPGAAVSVAVIGGGAIGSSAAWQLAARGHRVILFEQYAAGHARGASHGSSRIFRYSYPLADYVAFAGRADRLWHRLERLDGQRFYARTGSVDHGDPATVQRLARVLMQTRVEHSVLTPEQAAIRWPGLRFDGMVLHHPDSGRLHADHAVAALQRQARVAGAQTWFHTPAIGLRTTASGVRVLTASGSIRFDQIVVAAGAWTGELVAAAPALARQLPTLITTQEQPVHFAPVETPVGWPSFLHHPGLGHAGAAIYGLASPDGVKVGEHGTGPRVVPQSRNFLADPAGVARLQDYAARWIPGLDPTAATATTCLYTSTPDGHFVIDRAGPITVAAGFSGHGFKFAPAIGELVAGLVDGTADPPALFRLRAVRTPDPVPVGRS
jgi:sarcosine oxidase